MAESIVYRLPERMKELRKARGISQAMLAVRLGVSQSTVAGWETRKAEPAVRFILDMSLVFDTTIDYLLGATNKPEREDGGAHYEQVTPFERRILNQYRRMDEAEQAMLCRLIGIEHPADSRLKAKKRA